MTAQSVKSFLPKTSIRSRLMLVIGVLMVGVVGIFVGASYYGVRDAALAVGRERLRGLTDQLSTLFQQQARTLITQTRSVADMPVVGQYVQTGEKRLHTQLRTTLEQIGPPRDSTSFIELWNARKSFMFGLSLPQQLSDAPLDSEFVQAVASPLRGIVGKLRQVGDTLYYPVVIAIQGTEQPAGYLVRWRRFSSNQQAVDQLSRLLGTQAALYFANSDGSVWTDLITVVQPPPVDVLKATDIIVYERSGHGDVVASARYVQGTPWVLLIEFSHDVIMDASGIFLRGILIAGAVLLLVGLVVAWFLSRTITKPIATLTVATETFNMGDFSKPVEVKRQDEIGKLAFTFNAMVDRIQSSQREIEYRDVQIDKKSDELIQSEERYRHLFQSNPLPMWVFDAETLAFLAVNDAAIDKYGYSREEFLSMTIKDIRPPEEQQRLLNDLAQHHTGMDRAGTWKHKKKDGTVIAVEITSHEVEFSGRAAKLVLANDITEKLLAEAAVLYSEERYRIVAETASDGILTIDETSTILFANKAIRKVFGYTAEEILGKEITMLMPEYLRHVHRASVERYLKTGKKHISWEGIELPGVHKDGTEISLEVSFGENVKDGKHTFIGIIRDISERKRAEEALRINEKHNESLLRFSKQASQAQSHSDVLQAALEEVKLVLGYNNVWAYLFADDGKTASLVTIQGGIADSVKNEVPVLQVKGDKMLEEIFENDRPVVVEDARVDPRTNKDIVNALQNRTIVNVPMMLADKKIGAFGTGSFGDEGVRVPIKEQIDFFSTMANRISIAFNRIQLTEQRERAYEQIRKLNEDLERRVVERTSLLEAANKELESFSYSVSHDLRAPLRGIEGFSRLLLEDYAATLDDEGKRFLGNIIANTSKMGQLIDDLLAFSRLSRQELRVWTVDMMNMAQSIATDVSKHEQTHAVNLTLKSLPTVSGDGSMLRQVWQNLISNAYKFTRRVNNPRVEIGSYAENGEQIFYVKDNGAGFDMKYYDKLFGVFQRLHRQDEFEGTGVGLGIVQRVINRHGGRVWAEAALNKGATFYFSLPQNGR